MRALAASHRASRLGPTLAEVVMSTLLVGLLLIAALRSVGAAARTCSTAAELADGHALAQQLLGEIVALPYQEPNGTASFGPESGEYLTTGVRSGLDDVDDYIDWTDSPPRDVAGNALPGYSAWMRTADVQKVNPTDRSVRVDGDADLGMRLITVTVTSPAGRSTTLRAYRTTAGGYLQQQGVPQSLVTWVGLSLQAGAGPPVVGGTVVENHASDE